MIAQCEFVVDAHVCLFAANMKYVAIVNSNIAMRDLYVQYRWLHVWMQTSIIVDR